MQRSEQTYWHAMHLEAVLRRLQTTTDGLLEAEAFRRRKIFGPNVLPKEKLLFGWRLAFEQFKSPLLLLLAMAAMISAFLGESVDAAVIGVVVVLNAAIGFVQESKANHALARLRELIVPRVLVRRGVSVAEISSSEIVTGDVLLLSAGDRVVADARLLEVTDLEVNEMALTGESLPIAKAVGVLSERTPLAERTNMVYAGTGISVGHAVAVVVATARATELGKISELVRSLPESVTPLQRELRRLSLKMLTGALAVAVLLFGIGTAFGRGVVAMFQMAVALAVAAVPEGLPLAFTVILAVGTERLLRRRALVRRLVAAETLGSVSVICADKTGTLTQGTMDVHEMILPDGVSVLHDRLDDHKKASPDLRKLFIFAMLCNDAFVDQDVTRGSPTERALMRAGLQFGVIPADIQARYPRRAASAFQTTKKFAATLHERPEGDLLLIVMGAPEKILSACPSYPKAVEAAIERMTDQGLRMIAVASRREPATTQTVSNPLEELEFSGLFGLQDPLRPEVTAQVGKARAAGIRTVMVTGDHPNTAFAIAKEAGMISYRSELVLGAALDQWTDQELDGRVGSLAVYARTEPKHKIRIVQALQRRGEVVAMTGDGVNDAPALKAADIGVALGSGTEVAKESADVVLLDNNLATIVAAVEQGRVIFDNLRKGIVYLLSGSFTEMILIGGALLFQLPLPLLPLQILWINLVTDTLPSMALTGEAAEPDVMRRPPRSRSEPVLHRPVLLLMILIGAVITVSLFALYFWALDTYGDSPEVHSLLFAALGIDSLLYVYALRSLTRPFLRARPFSNPLLPLSVFVGLVAMVVAFRFPPLVMAFEVVALDLWILGLLLMMGLAKLFTIELIKHVLLGRSHAYAS